MHHIAIGCAGWSIPKEHKELFGDGESVLARYATRFSIVEINSSFYRSHRQATYARWADAVPRDFRFSVKLPKSISHEMALRGAGPALDAFLAEVAGLGDKLGGLLLQLPPGQRFDARAASTFFAMFRRRSGTPLACEPRHPSWFSDDAAALLERHRVSRVSADPAIEHDPDTAPASSPWPYWRLHGTPRVYYSPYSEDRLHQIAGEVMQRHASAHAPWIIFDNTAHGYATRDAARLQEILRTHVTRPGGSPDR